MRATPELGMARREDDLPVESVKNDNSFQESVRGCSSAMAINAPGTTAGYMGRVWAEKPGRHVQTHKSVERIIMNERSFSQGGG
jgi:hypothetical protein